MLKLLLISRDINPFNELTSRLKKYDDVELEISASGEKAFEMISGKAPDLAIVDGDLGDMTGLEFVKRLLKVNPMIDTAVVSALDPAEFHEASEGLGIMCQLPKKPDKDNTDKLVQTLKQIKGMLI